MITTRRIQAPGHIVCPAYRTILQDTYHEPCSTKLVLITLLLDGEKLDCGLFGRIICVIDSFA